MALCASCSKPLTLQVEFDEDAMQPSGASSSAQIQEVPDDVQLINCGCHFHWECILEAYEVTQCPHCSKQISTSNNSGASQILCNLLNEGGLQENLDILPILSEELYLKAYPEDRKPRAFLEFCREGDVEAIVDLLKAIDDDDDPSDGDEDEDMAESEDMNVGPSDSATVLRYQDPIGDMRSALHIAVISGHANVIWLLLLLASTLEAQYFPPNVQAAAEQMEVKRVDQTGKEDIRTLKDSHGNIPAHYLPASLGIDVTLLTRGG